MKAQEMARLAAVSPAVSAAIARATILSDRTDGPASS
jgi:hypothetical protein